MYTYIHVLWEPAEDLIWFDVTYAQFFNWLSALAVSLVEVGNRKACISQCDQVPTYCAVWYLGFQYSTFIPTDLKSGTNSLNTAAYLMYSKKSWRVSILHCAVEYSVQYGDNRSLITDLGKLNDAYQMMAFCTRASDPMIRGVGYRVGKYCKSTSLHPF